MNVFCWWHEGERQRSGATLVAYRNGSPAYLLGLCVNILYFQTGQLVGDEVGWKVKKDDMAVMTDV